MVGLLPTHPPPNVWEGDDITPSYRLEGDDVDGQPECFREEEVRRAQTTPPTTPTEGWPVRVRRPPSSLKEYDIR